MKFKSLILLPVTLSAFAATPDAVFARMDAAARAFRGMTANIRMISYTAVIKESTEESGRIALLSPKPRTVHALIQFEKPDQKAYSFRDKKVLLYLPKINTVQEYDFGKYDSLLTQGLLIGFATPSSELKKNYSVPQVTEETIEGTKCTKLTLVPQVATIKQHINKIELWISDRDGLPVQEKLYPNSGDYTQIVYSDMKLDPTLTDEKVKLNLPANVKKEYPQKGK